MTAVTPDWLNALALLDEALAQRPADRDAWLAELARSRPAVAPLLRKLLSAHGRVESHDILATLPKVRRGTRVADAGAAGLQVGPYELVEPIGRGGMGSVWRARYADGRLKREVAIKLPAVTADPETLATLRERFARERDFLAQLEHPNIARLYDAGVSESGQPYLAMEFVAGMPIAEHCDAKRLTVAARLGMFLQVLDAVGHAHQHLVLHRDLKASNVLVDEQGQVRLLDFGVARLLPPGVGGEPSDSASDAASELTERAGAAYTLGHAAPEQVTQGALSTATDVYALGVMLYHLLTGLPPYQPVRDTRGALEDAVLLATPVAASLRSFTVEALAARQCTAPALRKALRGDLDTILARALKKNPAERYATVAALADDLRRHLARQPIAARADGWWYRSRLFVARNRWPVAGTTAAVLAVLATAAVAVWQAKVSANNAALAARSAARANQVQDFFARQLAKADPTKNKNITAADRQMVDGALAEAQTQFSDPETLLAVLRQLAEIYVNVGNYNRYLLVLKKRVAVLQELPNAEPDEWAEAHIALAYALRYSKDPEERQAAIARSVAAYDLAAKSGASAEWLVQSLFSISDLYRQRTDYELADQYSKRALDLAQESLPKSHPKLAQAFVQRVVAASDLGDFDTARASYLASTKAGELEHGHSPSTNLKNQILWANVEFDAGNYLESRRLAFAALDYAYLNLGEAEATLTAPRIRVVLASERAGELKEAARLASSIFAGDLQSGDAFRYGRARYAQGVVALARGEWKSALQAFQEAQPGLSDDLRWKWRAPTQLARLELKRGQAVVAQKELMPLVTDIRSETSNLNEQFIAAAELLGVASARLGLLDAARELIDEACAWPRVRRKAGHPLRVRCESYAALLSETLSRDSKQRVLSTQMANLLRDREDVPPLFASLRRAQEWLARAGSDASRLKSFPLLD